MRTGDILIKHQHIFIYYKLYCDAHNQKETGSSLSRLYFEIAKPFYVEPQSAAKIIYKMLKNGYTPTEMEVKDFKRRFKDVDIVVKNIA